MCAATGRRQRDGEPVPYGRVLPLIPDPRSLFPEKAGPKGPLFLTAP